MTVKMHTTMNVFFKSTSGGFREYSIWVKSAPFRSDTSLKKTLL